MAHFDTELIERGKNPEKHFFWGVMHAVRKELVEQMLEEVMHARISAAAGMPNR